MSCDVLVIGGGPAGATTAALLRQHNPSLRVLLVEQAEFPRYHIGESLVLEVNRILLELGLFDTVERAGFLKKGGATYIWGADRKPWSFLFEESTGQRPHFEGQVDYTFHVERARFDKILLDCARDRGVEILQPARVASIRSDGGRVTGARISLATGEERELEARFVVDASGRAGVLAGRFGRRVFDPVLRNVATFGYFRGARLDADCNGSWDRSRISIVSNATGWTWFIPIEPGVVSVGVVTSAERFRALAAAGPERFYQSTLRETPETAAWLRDAELIEFHGSPRRVMVESDFNYCHDRWHGPGYALVGDAAGFLDPLFTFGVFLSMTGARLLAYTLGTLLDSRIAAPEERLLGAYQQHMRTYFDSFRAMLYTFYGFNSTKESFWRETRELVRSQALPDHMTDREAFMATTFGYGVNTLLFHECLQHFGGVALNRIRDMLLGGDGATTHLNQPGDYNPAAIPREARPRRIAGYRVEESAVPLDGTGRMVPMSRVEFQIERPGEARFPRHFFMPDAWVDVLARMDGRASLGELLRTVTALPRPRWLGDLAAERFFPHALKSMVAMGVVELA